MSNDLLLKYWEKFSFRPDYFIFNFQLIFLSLPIQYFSCNYAHRHSFILSVNLGHVVIFFFFGILVFKDCGCSSLIYQPFLFMKKKNINFIFLQFNKN